MIETAASWKRRLAEAHPDRGGDPSLFRELVEARNNWYQAQPQRCMWCHGPMPKKAQAQATPRQFCRQHCAALASAVSRRKRQLLKTGKRTEKFDDVRAGSNEGHTDFHYLRPSWGQAGTSSIAHKT